MAKGTPSSTEDSTNIQMWQQVWHIRAAPEGDAGSDPSPGAHPGPTFSGCPHRLDQPRLRFALTQLAERDQQRSMIFTGSSHHGPHEHLAGASPATPAVPASRARIAGDRPRWDHHVARRHNARLMPQILRHTSNDDDPRQRGASSFNRRRFRGGSGRSARAQRMSVAREARRHARIRWLKWCISTASPAPGGTARGAVS
jgi:hypothetical protein